jgi:hypothetical protein
MAEHMLKEIGFTPAGWYMDGGHLFGLALGRTSVCSEEMFGGGYWQKMAACCAWQGFGYLPSRYLYTFSMAHRHLLWMPASAYARMEKSPRVSEISGSMGDGYTLQRKPVLG